MKKTAESKDLNEDASNYDNTKYPKANHTTDVIVCHFDGEDIRVLLIKRSFPPFRDHWVIPGGFVDIATGQSLDQSAQRELMEETGLKDLFLQQLKSYGDPNRDPRARTITTAYYSIVPMDQKLEVFPQDEEVKEWKWFPLNHLPKELGFDHQQILQDLKEELKIKVRYTPIAFHFLGKFFTYGELQNVYENLLNQKLLAPNFRRKINSIFPLIQTQKKQKTRGRSSWMYTLDNSAFEQSFF